MKHSFWHRCGVLLGCGILAWGWSLGAGAQAGGAETGTSPAKLSELETRINAVEDDIETILGKQDKLTETLKQNRLNWSGSYRATVNNFHLLDRSVEQPQLDHFELVVDGLGQPIAGADGKPLVKPIYIMVPKPASALDAWYGSNWVNRLRLTLTSDITDNLRFYGQITAFKYFNELKQIPVTLDQHTTRYPRDPTMRIERAYFDWFATDWLAFSVGRVAAPEGPPAELKENGERNATWGVQMVEAEMETVMATLNLAKFMKGTHLRLFYIPFLNHTDFSLNDDLKLFQDGGIDPMHAFGALFEFGIPGMSKSLGQVGTVHVPSFRPRNLPIQIEGISNPIYPSTWDADLGVYTQINGLVELKDIASSGLDLFLAYTLTLLKPSTGRMTYLIPHSPIPVIHPMTQQEVSKVTDPLPLQIGLAGYDNCTTDATGKPSCESSSTGHMLYAGFRYTLPVFGEYAPRLGAEFNWGSRYHIAWASPSDLLVNKLATKGLVWEVYYIQQLVPKHLFVRLGFLQLRRDYVGLYIGPTTEVDQTIENAYCVIEALW